MVVMIDPQLVRASVETAWDSGIVDVLRRYIEIPNKSPAFDPGWSDHGHMDRAVEMFVAWARSRPIDGLTVEVVRLSGRTPLILIEVPATAAGSDEDPDRSEPRTVLLYGHLDKQPEMEGWDADKGPWQPVLVGERLYGRGGADDGYAMFAALSAVEAVRAAGGSHSRLVIMIEASEESGSPDLPAYVDHLVPRLGTVDLVVCLDSGAADYDALWVTTSLRGLAGGTLEVTMLEEGLHSGSASGVVPSTFRILRHLLDRVEDSATGQILLPELNAPIPASVVTAAVESAEVLADEVVESLPFVEGARAVSDDVAELVVNRTWRPTLSVTGLDGAPPPEDAGNVLRPRTRAKLSFRLPPTVDSQAALEAIEHALTSDPPYGARVELTEGEAGPGWCAPELEPWLAAALTTASEIHFGRPVGFQGEGGSIPFMGMLGERFPSAQFVVTGVLGPGSNAHGPNEFLDLPTARRLTACVAHVLDGHATRSRS